MSHLFDDAHKRPSRAEAEAYLAKLKTAGPIDFGKEVVRQALQNHKAAVIGGVVGAALVGAAQYRLNKPGPDGVSTNQSLSHGVDQGLAEKQREISQHRDLTLPEKMLGAVSHTTKDITDIFAEHPRSAAVSGAIVGGSVGAKYLPLLIKALTS